MINYYKAIELNPNQPDWVYKHLGKSLNETNLLKEAIDLYERALQLRPENDSFYSLLGDSYCKKGDIEKGISCYLSAIKLQQDESVEPYRSLANTLKAYGNINTTIFAYRKIINVTNKYSR